MRLTKTASTLLIIIVAVSACKKTDKNEGATETGEATPGEAKNVTKTPSAPPKTEWTGADTAKVMQGCWSAFNSKDEATYIGCYADDAEFSYVDFAPPMTLKGAKTIAGIIKMWWSGFPDANADPQLVLVNENQYAAIVLLSQTNTGKKAMMPATGKKSITFEAQAGSLNADGKISTDHHFVDQATMAHQMGMQPSERSPDAETPWVEKSVVIANNDDKEKANLAFIEGLGTLVDEQGTAALLAVVADDVSFRYVGDKRSYSNKGDYEKGLGEYMSMVKVSGREVKTAWAAGDWVFTVTKVRATMLEDMPGAKGSKGKDVTTIQTEFFMVADGKIRKHWIFENTMQYAIQLGLIDPTKMGHK